MSLHFSHTELAGRRRRACRQMVAQGLDGLLVFRQDGTVQSPELCWTATILPR